MAALRHISRKIIPNKAKLDGILQINNSCAVCIRLLNYTSKEYDAKNNPTPVFFNKEVQTLLKSLTRVDLAKVFRKRKLGDKKLEDPTYKFMTNEELQEAIEDAKKKADELLQIPPIVPVRQPIQRVLSNDPALQGLETSRHIFTDITFGVKDSDRIIVVREPDGVLREADWELRDRINQVYFPRAGRYLKPPKMFEDNYLENLFNRKEYEFILDCACYQFEPSDPRYQRVVSITYQHVNDNNEFEILRSTRHFGALTFFLVWNKMIDNLLLDLIETSHIEEANDLLVLYCKVNKVELKSDQPLMAIEQYISKFSNKKGVLELALQSYKDVAKQREELEKGIRIAHGL